MQLYRGAAFIFLMALMSCGNSPTSAIAHQLEASENKSVDLASAVPGSWDRVCILGPYSNDAEASRTLGFKWHAEALTSIEENDGISLLLFVRDNTVLSYVEHSRGSGDFSNLTGRCFPRTSTRFVLVAHPSTGLPGLFPADEP
jgi:hypothetical protein